MKNIVIFTAMALLINSCKKTPETIYTLKGQIIGCINGNVTPNLKNTAIDLFQKNDGSNFNAKVLATTTTDANGNFAFAYSTTNGGDKLIVRTAAGFGFADLMTNIPIGDISNLKIYYSGGYNLVVGLNVTKPYNITDTLILVKPDSLRLIKIPGPFVSGRVFKINNRAVNPSLNYLINGDIIKCRLNNTIYLDKEFIIENNKLCGDTVYVNIDVR